MLSSLFRPPQHDQFDQLVFMPNYDANTTEVDAAHRRLVCAVIIQSIKDAQRDDEARAWLDSELCADWLDVLNLADAFHRRGVPVITGRALWRQNGASQQAGRIRTQRRV